MSKSERQSTPTTVDDYKDTEDNTEIASSETYVDYTLPETAKILPPAKYKLFLLILVLVYLAVFVTELAGLNEFLLFRGWISPDGALFIFLGILVFVLVYAALDFVVAIFTFHKSDDNHGTKYGLGAWLKAPRVTWTYKYSNIFAETLTGIIQILEEGFAMFNAPHDDHQQVPKRFSCPDGKCQKTLRIEHRISSTKIKEYNQWLEKIDAAAKKNAPGLIKVQRPSNDDGNNNNIETGLRVGDDDHHHHHMNDLSSSSSHDDGKDGGLLHSVSLTFTDIDGGNNNNIETGLGDDHFHNEGDLSSYSSHDDGKDDGLLQYVLLTFTDIHSMNEWMLSPRRKVLMDDLKRLLVVPDVVQIRLDRELPDAFTDLLTYQGEFVPKLPPKKWKVWWLTTIALYLSIKWVNHFMSYYYEFWGLNNAHVRLQVFVANVVTVFVNAYIMVPLLLFFFNHWLKRKDAESNIKEPWRTLNDGFQSIWSKAFLTFLLYGGCVFVWVVKMHT